MPRADSVEPPPDATVAYTDGACRGNPGPGGWAWAVPGGRWESGYDPATTNQRMEILAAHRAVIAHDGPVHIVSDSTYVVNCFRDEWWKGWIKRGWKNSKKEPVANRDLWEPFIEVALERNTTFDWVKGHSGDPMNDLVDRLAVAASISGVGAAGDEPPDESDLGPADDAGAPVTAGPSAGAPPSASVVAGDATAAARKADPRVPEGTPFSVVGLRSGALEESDTGVTVRRRLGEVLDAHRQLYPDLVVLSGLRAGAERLGAEVAQELGIDHVAVLPYPDPMAGRPAVERDRFDQLCAAARSVVTLEKKRPDDAAGKRASLARRDGWLRAASFGAIVITDGRDAEAESLRRRFTDALGDEVWLLETD